MAGRPKVLLVEPDAQLALTYSHALTSAGFSVRASSGAQAAIRLADTWTPDVVVLELQLAGHNGVEFLYEFRSYSEWTTIPVVLLTFIPPRSLMITARLMESLGIHDCLYKPTATNKIIIQAVSNALATRVTQTENV